MDRHHPRDLTHIVVDRIALGDAPRRQRMADVMDVVQRHHRLQAGQARRHHLGSAAEPGKEMRFDETRRDAHVGIQPCGVEEHLDAR